MRVMRVRVIGVIRIISEGGRVTSPAPVEACECSVVCALERQCSYRAAYSRKETKNTVSCLRSPPPLTNCMYMYTLSLSRTHTHTHTHC